MKYANPLELECENYSPDGDFNGARGQGLTQAKYSKMSKEDLEKEADFHYATDFLKNAKPLYEGGNIFYATLEKAKLLTSYHPNMKNINGNGGTKRNIMWCAKNGTTQDAVAIGSMFERKYKTAEKILRDLK